MLGEYINWGTIAEIMLQPWHDISAVHASTTMSRLQSEMCTEKLIVIE